MQHSIEKFLFFTLLGIFLFSFPVYLIASETADDSLLSSQASSEHKNEQTSSGLKNQHTASNPIFQSQRDLFGLIFGINMTIIGLLAVALALYRWKANDLSLISFGVFCFINGARSGAFQYIIDAPLEFWSYWRWFLSYLTPVPVWIFFEQFIGKGWKSSIRRLWQIQIIFVIGAVSVGLILRSPDAAKEANNVMSIVGILVAGSNIFRPGLGMTRELLLLKYGGAAWAMTALYENIAPLVTPGYIIVNIEPFGQLVFLGCLVYVVAYRFFQNEKELITIAHELETARQIQSFILPQKTVDIKGIYLAAHYVPMASVAGDFYDFIKVDEKRLGILVADVSGHGVPASLISSMVKIALSSQLPHANNPAEVLCGINQILCGKLESDFVTAGYLFIDTESQTATYAGAGHPPLLLWRGSEQKIHEYREKGIILGQFEDARYQNIELSLQSGDRFILYTDGIIEAANAAGDLFGWSRFKEFISSQAGLSVGNFADGLLQHISDWSGKHLDEALDDDLTLVVADFKNS
jgi:sigma-B regulation protein RsbU (phosphoserine phosphatase)